METDYVELARRALKAAEIEGRRAGDFCHAENHLGWGDGLYEVDSLSLRAGVLADAGAGVNFDRFNSALNDLSRVKMDEIAFDIRCMNLWLAPRKKGRM